MTPTSEQTTIVSAAQSGANLMINAYAGTAKTTTLTMIASSVQWTSALCLAFNVKIKDELRKKMPPEWDVLTLNGLGHRAWAKAIGKNLTLEPKKLGQIVTTILKEHQIQATADEWSNVRRLVSAAQQAGVVPQGYPHRGLLPDINSTWEDIADSLWIEATPLLINIAREVLRVSVKQAFAGLISFDDQIYMSTLFNGVFPRYDHVLVDEAQDLSPLNHIQISRCAKGQIIAAGDPCQAIYAFRGADSNSMTNLRKIRNEWIDLPLTTTFRCPRNIVVRQQSHAPGYNAYAANITGEITELGEWNYSDHLAPRGYGIAIISRNNAPLLAMAFKLIRIRIGCHMLGRDIGKGLIALSKKIIPDDNTSKLDACTAVCKWREQERFLAIANGKEDKIEGIEDRAECLLAVLEYADCITAKDMRVALDSLFSRSAGMITLSTIHRAKGLEWNTVVHLDPWRIPSKFATQAAKHGNHAPLRQENNLRYVCETRARQTLILANLEGFK